jgi:hypothetical protein
LRKQKSTVRLASMDSFIYYQMMSAWRFIDKG